MTETIAIHAYGQNDTLNGARTEFLVTMPASW